MLVFFGLVAFGSIVNLQASSAKTKPTDAQLRHAVNGRMATSLVSLRILQASRPHVCEGVGCSCRGMAPQVALSKLDASGTIHRISMLHVRPSQDVYTGQ